MKPEEIEKYGVLPWFAHDWCNSCNSVVHRRGLKTTNYLSQPVIQFLSEPCSRCGIVLVFKEEIVTQTEEK